MKYYTYEIFETVLNNFWISFKKTNKFYKISNEKTEDHISGYPDYRNILECMIVLSYYDILKNLFLPQLSQIWKLGALRVAPIIFPFESAWSENRTKIQ